MIPVTKSFIPPLEDYSALVRRAFDKGWLTNRGELVLELEEALTRYLDVERLIIMTNGTLPLQIAAKVLGQGGEIITTPFSYVATVSSIVWEQCTPVFVDIEADYWTIDPAGIEAAITPRTRAILGTHVFGNPCDVEAIQAIAARHGLAVIYDAAHCFGVRYKEQSIFRYGNVSTCSFHATKLFHTGEGGAVFCANQELHDQFYYSHNFGHNGPLDFHGLGINAKISELQAAMGLAVLPHIEEIIASRKAIVDRYLTAFAATNLQAMTIRPGTHWNYSYFPVVFASSAQRTQVEKALLEKDIVPRRYFYPSLNTLPYVDHVAMPQAESIAERILCLPLYVGLEEDEQARIIQIILAQL